MPVRCPAGWATGGSFSHFGVSGTAHAGLAVRGVAPLIGVESSHLAALQVCEAAWRATQPACGCPAGPPEVEQPSGTSVASKDDDVVACGNWTSTSGICITQPK